MIDVGTLGSTPSQVVLNDMLIKLNDKKVTHAVTSRFIKANTDLKKLQKYVLSQDIQFYDKMLAILRNHHMDAVKEADPANSELDLPAGMPTDVYTHWRCVMTGLFRQAKRAIEQQVKENIRRTQRGQQPL
jgi:hypothetical protein